MTKMNKSEFLLALAEGLASLPWEDTEERLNFYSEMIDDRIEEGLSEEEAVAAVGSPKDIVNQLLADAPLTTIVKSKISQKKSWRAWEIILLVLGSPVWLPLLLAAAAIILSVYVTIWAIVISFWAIFVSFAACGLALILTGIASIFFSNIFVTIALIGCGLILAGGAIFLFFVCKLLTLGTARLAKIMVLGIKKSFSRKERG